MLRKLIGERSEAIARRWFEDIAAGYPEQTVRFLDRQQDPFANPVGTSLREATRDIVDGLAAGVDATTLAPSLDRIVRVRAVQEMSPADAVGFVFSLKGLLRAELADVRLRAVKEIEDLDRWVDRLALAAFEVYTGCREEIYSIRVREIHNRSLKMMERLNAWRVRRDDGPRIDSTEEP